jgi:hypothetical protein
MLLRKMVIEHGKPKTNERQTKTATELKPKKR